MTSFRFFYSNSTMKIAVLFLQRFQTSNECKSEEFKSEEFKSEEETRRSDEEESLSVKFLLYLFFVYNNKMFIVWSNLCCVKSYCSMYILHTVQKDRNNKSHISGEVMQTLTWRILLSKR